MQTCGAKERAEEMTDASCIYQAHVKVTSVGETGGPAEHRAKRPGEAARKTRVHDSKLKEHPA